MNELNFSYATDAGGDRRVVLSDDALAYVTNFVRDTAATSAAEIAAVAQEGHDAVIRNIDGLTDVQARYKPSPDDWSVLEAMAHIVTFKRINVALTSNLGAGTLPPGFGPQLENENAQYGITLAKFETIAEAREAAESAHKELLAVIAKIDDADRDTRFTHFAFGAMNAREWASFQRIHDGDHFPQLAKITSSARFPSA